MPRTRSLAWSELKIGVMAVVALALGLGEGERPAIATEAHAPAPAPGRRALVHFAPVEPQAIEPASAPLPSPADPPRTEDTEEDTLPAAENESESARSSITPMEKDEAVQHLSRWLTLNHARKTPQV